MSNLLRKRTHPIAPYPDDLPRCCEDTLKQDGPIGEPSEGLELPCNWCMDSLRFEQGTWVRLLGKLIIP